MIGILCRICYEPVAPEAAVKVPFYSGDTPTPRPLVHRSCLERAVRYFAADADRQKLLRYIVEYEKAQRPRDWLREATDNATDACWAWDDIGLPPSKIRPLVDAGIASVVYSSHSTTEYALTGRDIVERVLLELEQAPADIYETFEEPELEIPDDLFSIIAGYEDIKEFLRKALKAERFHVLFIGPPASAKTVFLLELARLPGSFYCLGSATTKAGLAEVLCEQRPRVLLADEIDKFQLKDLALLLSLAETGIVRETKVGKQREVRLKTNVFAAANSARNMPKELLSRFRVLYLDEYTRDQFIEVSRKVLIEREKVVPELASYIAEKAWEVSRDVREAVRMARICGSPEEVDRDVEFMRKYGIAQAKGK